MQENSRVAIKRLKAIHVPDADLTEAGIDALSLYLTCDDVALRQLSVSQNPVSFLPSSSPRKCDTKRAFLAAVLQNKSLHWLLSRQSNLTASELVHFIQFIANHSCI